MLFSFITGANAACGVPAVAQFGTINKTATSATVYWRAISGAVSYDVQWRVRNTGAAWSGPGNTTGVQYNITGLTGSTNYEFQVRTNCGANGTSAYSASGWFTTTASTSTCNLPALSTFATTNKTASSATVSWNAVTGATSYNVKWKVRTLTTWSNPVNTTSASYNITGLSASTNYEFQVQTVCPAGTSAYSASGWFTTTSSTSTCATPVTSGITNITTVAATVSWNAATGATSYNLRWKPTTSSAWSSATTSNVQYNLTGLTSGTSYEFQVQTVCASGASAYSASGLFTTVSNTGGSVPHFDHIVIVIGENTNASAVIGNANAPYINSVASAGINLTQSYALTHPSQPNYLMLFSGSNQNVLDDNKPASHFTTTHVAKTMADVGKTCINYSETMPSVGYDGASSGSYVRKHNYIANWMGTGTNQVSTTLNQPFTSFPTNFANLPNLAIVVPNLCSDGHDVCPPISNRTRQYDTWVQNNLDAYKQWCINNNSLLIITYDENDGSSGNQIATVMYGANMVPGAYSQTVNHYNILRTICDAFGAAAPGAAATATPVNFCWTTPPAPRMAVIENTEEPITVYPNPTSGVFKIVGKSNERITITDLMGRIIIDKIVKLPADIDISEQPAGIYGLRIGDKLVKIVRR